MSEQPNGNMRFQRLREEWRVVTYVVTILAAGGTNALIGRGQASACHCDTAAVVKQIKEDNKAMLEYFQNEQGGCRSEFKECSKAMDRMANATGAISSDIAGMHEALDRIDRSIAQMRSKS